MSWASAAPNLLIGLREGLEAGLVVSILLAALQKSEATGRRLASTPIWLGVLGAVMVSGSFAAVLTYSTDVLSSRAQEAVGGILSVLAVGLVTGMVFWMRRTAAGLSAHLRGEVERAARIGAGALALTAFLSVGREGLETTLFIWTAVKASGQTFAPLFGAALGLLIAIVVCALLYRRAVRLNLGVFFSRTAVILIVIAAGILAYGLGDLQDAGLLPGQQWIAFDVTAHIDPGAWWVTIITGATELAPKMTVLQVVAWIGYLGAVIPAFVRAGRTTALPRGADAPKADDRWERLAGRRPWTVAGVLVVVPVVAAATAIVALPSADAASTTAVSVTSTACAPEWTSGHSGSQVFEVDNKSSHEGEVNLDDAAGAVVAEIETLGPATTATMSATLDPGTYTFKCLMSGAATTTSNAVSVTGSATASAPAAITPVTVAELTGPNDAYQAYVLRDMAGLRKDVAALRRTLERGPRAAAEKAWLTAQLDWERVGASYDSFGQLGLDADGLPDGLEQGVKSSQFTGLHRIEYGLYHGQSLASLVTYTNRLDTTITKIDEAVKSDDIAGDPTNLPIRAHEIIEDALRDHLPGIDDEGAGAAYPETWADTQVDVIVLHELAALIQARAPKVLPTAMTQLHTLQRALLATKRNGHWQAPSATSQTARQQVDADIGALLETLASVPDLLEVPPNA